MRANVSSTLEIAGEVRSTRGGVVIILPSARRGCGPLECLLWRAIAVAGVNVVQKLRMCKVKKEAIYREDVSIYSKAQKFFAVNVR